MNSTPSPAPPATAGGRNLPTLEEVAARAGVSRATASRVLRGASNVSEQARAAVLSAAEAGGAAAADGSMSALRIRRSQPVR
jgi:DNA-binding LacI/PurR family transcriptional regulator